MLDTDCLMGLVSTHVEEYTANIKLLPEVYDAYLRLKLDAKLQGFDLSIASAYRSYDRQVAIWNAKALGHRPVLDNDEQALNLQRLPLLERVIAIMRWSALPGTSRHHWGTDFDIYDAAALKEGQSLSLTVKETAEGGVFFDMYQWLGKYLKDQDTFFRPYEKDQGGVAIEPWHLSYTTLAREVILQLDKDTLYRVLSEQEFELKETVLTHFESLYERFVANIYVG